jgi:molybdopterin-guanine dinucleotide biosynthesis protein A
MRAASITAVVLAGGLGTRMGGVDKGLQPLRGTPLALHALRRLQAQHGGLLHDCLINANRNLPDYAAFGVPVCPDTLQGYAGPLAGFLAGLQRCSTPYLLTVPCDSPLFPLDLAQRLAQALHDAGSDMAMVSAPDDDGTLRSQPVFTLLRADLQASLTRYTQAGGRQIEAWSRQHRTVLVPFNAASDDPLAFSNVNTLAALRALQT